VLRSREATAAWEVVWVQIEEGSVEDPLDGGDTHGGSIAVMGTLADPAAAQTR
jgi:hypothetical protein